MEAIGLNLNTEHRENIRMPMNAEGRPCHRARLTFSGMRRTRASQSNRFQFQVYHLLTACTEGIINLSEPVSSPIEESS